MAKKLLYKAWRSLAALLLLGFFTASPIVAQTTAFNYQGKLTDAGNPANGTYDMQFKLFDTVTVGTGTQQGSTVTVSNVAVSNGSFSVQLDFGATVFDGSARFLETGVRPAGSPNPYTVLSPRQAINSAPYAINTRQLGGLPATRYVATDTNGNVGIGTATPSTKLEVVDPVRQLRFGPTTADNGGYLISTVPHQAIITGGAKWDAPNWIARDTVASFTAHHFGAIQFFTDSNLSVGSPYSPSARMTIRENGFVGIGTTVPEQMLHMHGGKILLTGSDAAYTFRDRNSGSSADDWALYAAGGSARLYNNSFGDLLAVTTNGFVGIGTTAPQTKLHVVDTGIAQSTVQSLNERAILALDSTLAGQRRIWTLESGIFGTPGLFGIYDYTASRARLTIDTTGLVGVKALAIQGGADFSENFDISEANNSRPGAVANDLAPGLVVSIDQKNPGKLIVSRQAYDRSVAGIISGAGGVSPGLVMGQKGSMADGNYPVALSGRVWVYADASRQPIKPGDLLTTSAIPGHAMKVMNHRKANGAIIGKAMTALKSGRGLVLVLVSLQ